MYILRFKHRHYMATIKKLIIRYHDENINLTDDMMKEIRDQFENEDVVFMKYGFDVEMVEYDEVAVARRTVKKYMDKNE